MSKVISFRLDKDNPREGEALAILEANGKAGYSIRHILTEALLRLNDEGFDRENLHMIKSILDLAT